MRERSSKHSDGHSRSISGPHLEVPGSFLSTLKDGVAVSAQTGFEALIAGRPRRGLGSHHGLWMSIMGSVAGDT
jgi:hypothetical protein